MLHRSPTSQDVRKTDPVAVPVRKQRIGYGVYRTKEQQPARRSESLSWRSSDLLTCPNCHAQFAKNDGDKNREKSERSERIHYGQGRRRQECKETKVWNAKIQGRRSAKSERKELDEVNGVNEIKEVKDPRGLKENPRSLEKGEVQAGAPDLDGVFFSSDRFCPLLLPPSPSPSLAVSSLSLSSLSSSASTAASGHGRGFLADVAVDLFKMRYGLDTTIVDKDQLVDEVMAKYHCSRRALNGLFYGSTYHKQLASLRARIPDYKPLGKHDDPTRLPFYHFNGNL